VRKGHSQALIGQKVGTVEKWRLRAVPRVDWGPETGRLEAVEAVGNTVPRKARYSWTGLNRVPLIARSILVSPNLADPLIVNIIRMINSAKLCLSHPLGRIKWIDQWAVDPDPVLTVSTSAKNGKTAILVAKEAILCCRFPIRVRHNCARAAHLVNVLQKTGKN